MMGEEQGVIGRLTPDKKRELGLVVSDDGGNTHTNVVLIFILSYPVLSGLYT